ncbi:MAG: heparan-alpha-glucosaminide N-acetyltransferase domain-containing protein [Candidatus Pseudobacter hemicellulosilyticus]|uniref:Heparan-alpha-glucosaminide N-acetyltransferase domain-containing protein n=1 Tax=Candidatus Pseudobacter hemicellulosilyticus TaxID=3121375 RepID=A0AAJ5WWD6_9BACT|nr:MAG: heparan-alpha-glucosaminide N-acetyltransferase domain-containing protein [Pseudobacter sp.]
MRSRIVSLDVVRGLIMVIMALDHTRDYFTDVRFDPTDLSQASPALFLTRWITHYCAPVFVFLAGTAAFLYGRKVNNKKQLSRFLWSRGGVLVLLELTLVHLGFWFNFSYNFIVLQVIWAIGMSMIVLAALVWLPLRWIAVFGLVLILGHNALDGIAPADTGAFAVPWTFLHVQSVLPLAPNHQLFVGYTLIPWIGVMAAGYAFGQFFTLGSERRRSLFLRLGAGMILGFLLLRGLNIYGDPRPWSAQQSSLYTVLSFLNVTKYPPSLSYLLMTLGPAILLLGLLERGVGRIGQFFSVYGKVPLFYYLLHFYIIHTLTIIAGAAQGFDPLIFFNFPFGYPPSYGFPLWAVYLWWIGIVALLYFPCKWYGKLKSRSQHPVFSYI